MQVVHFAPRTLMKSCIEMYSLPLSLRPCQVHVERACLHARQLTVRRCARRRGGRLFSASGSSSWSSSSRSSSSSSTTTSSSSSSVHERGQIELFVPRGRGGPRGCWMEPVREGTGEESKPRSHLRHSRPAVCANVRGLKFSGSLSLPRQRRFRLTVVHETRHELLFFSSRSRPPLASRSARPSSFSASFVYPRGSPARPASRECSHRGESASKRDSPARHSIRKTRCTRMYKFSVTYARRATIRWRRYSRKRI